MCSDQVQRLAEDRVQKSVSLENTQRRLSDANKSSQRMTKLLEESQSKLARKRDALANLQIELEKERQVICICSPVYFFGILTKHQHNNNNLLIDMRGKELKRR